MKYKLNLSFRKLKERENPKKYKKHRKDKYYDRDHHRDRHKSIDSTENVSEKNKLKEDIHWSQKSASEMTERDWRIFREDNDIILKGGRVPFPIRIWSEGNLPDYILNAIKDAGYKKPTPIQMQGIPVGIEKRDMIALAPTGSGKSAAFLIPLIIYLNSLPPIDSNNNRDGPYAIILAPSRELALQIYEEFNKFAKYTKLRAASVVGGRSSEEQAVLLGNGVEVIIGTPGRIQDTLERNFTILNQCNYVVLDEADKMIHDGLESNVNYILNCIPDNNLKSEDEKIAEQQEKECKLGNKKYRITMMFSATMTRNLENLARKYLRCPSYISIGEPGAGKKEIEQRIEFISENQKRGRLFTILEKFKPPIIIFVNHKKSTELLCKTLEKSGYKATSLHGGKSQESREKALNGFKDGKYDILICTNLAARGIDVEGVSLVINYDAPFNIEDYNHRIGRTGRAGLKGTSITFITNSDEALFYDLNEYLIHNNQPVPQELSSHPATKIKPGTNVDNLPRRRQILYAA
jgi:ATP-dependent RNA helicase DDX23/PRP28